MIVSRLGNLVDIAPLISGNLPPTADRWTGGIARVRRAERRTLQLDMFRQIEDLQFRRVCASASRADQLRLAFGEGRWLSPGVTDRLDSGEPSWFAHGI